MRIGFGIVATLVAAIALSGGPVHGASAPIVITLNIPSSSQLDATGCGGPTYTSTVLADSPISYWRLDEESGTNAVDQQGNATATYGGPYTLGSPGAISGSSNKAVTTVGGTGGGTAAITGLDVDTGTNAYNTVEFWMKWDGVGNVDPFAFHQYSLWFSSATRFGFNTASGDIYGINGAAVTALANRWVHVVAVFRNNGQVTSNKLYLDGQLQSLSQHQGTPNTAVSVTANANISGTGWTNQYRFGGSLDEVSVYTGELSAARVAAHYAAGKHGNTTTFGTTLPGSSYVTGDCRIEFGSADSTSVLRMSQADGDGYAMTAGPDADVVGRWHFNETYADPNGGNDAVVGAGTPGFAVSGHDPEYGDALQLDGSSRVDVPDTASQRIDAFTVDLWFKTATIANNPLPTLLSKGTSSTNRNYGLWFDSGACACLKAGMSVGGSAREVTTPAAPLTTNTWHHAAMVANGVDLVLYVDGAEVARTAAAGNVNNPSLPIGIGQRTDGTGSFLGQIDEVRITSGTSATGMHATPIPDYGDGGIDWSSPGLFGVCLRTAPNATPAWTTGPSSTCPTTTGAYWNGIPQDTGAATNIVSAAPGVINAAAVLNFGLKVPTAQAVGPSSARIAVTVVAPAV